MSQLHYIRKREAGQHLTIEDRKHLEYLYNENLKRPKKDKLNQKELAKILGWSEATLSRELKRGKVKQKNSMLEEYTAYSSVVAQKTVEKTWSNKGPSLKISNDHILAKIIENMLIGKEMNRINNLKFSPAAITMYFDRVGWPTDKRLCTRTIYNYVEKEVFLEVTMKDLPRKGNKPRQRKRYIEKRLSPPDKKRINHRPKAIEERTETGHWEMDCIESSKGDRTCLLTLVDRCTRECIILKINTQRQESVVKKLNAIERKLGARAFREKFKSITVDNGAEFQDWKSMEKSIHSEKHRTSIYYAHAYSSWERGSNENLNGFIRYFIPKGTKLKDIPQREINKLEEFINSYPRKVLEGNSANSKYLAIA